MKIDGIGGKGQPQPAETPAGRDNAAKPGAPEVEGRDRVEVSETARRIPGLLEAAGRLPEIRQERVNALREAIETGTFRVDSRLLARALLEFEDGLPD